MPDPSPRNDASNLDEWRDRLSGAGSPVFATTVRDVSNVATNRESSARDLSDVIGNDASMAARVLKIANSSLFNLPVRVDTISSAVVRLGFDAIRELAISVAVIEQMKRGRRHERVTRHMAHAFHAAAQARSFAACSGDKHQEEVFLAALLREVGEMAFWSHAKKEGDAIAERAAAGEAWEDAERGVLGFELRELTRHLVTDWSLGELLQASVDSFRPTGRARNVVLGHEVARGYRRPRLGFPTRPTRRWWWRRKRSMSAKQIWRNWCTTTSSRPAGWRRGTG